MQERRDEERRDYTEKHKYFQEVALTNTSSIAEDSSEPSFSEPSMGALSRKGNLEN
jgi:hypothetical protein